MKVVGYVRVSTTDQHLEPQLEVLTKFCDFKKWDIVNIYEDKLSGRTIKRTGFEAMLKALKGNPLNIDAVIIYKLDRISRSVSDLVKISEYLMENKVGLVSTQENLDTTTKEGRFFFHIMSSVAQLERDNILERTALGRAYKISQGYKWGRPELKVDMDEIKRQIAMGIPKATIAKKFKISRKTLYNKINELKNDKKVVE